MNKEEMICKNCKYHYIEEISFDYPQSCCDKRKAVIEEWFNCNDFKYSDKYIEQLQQENKKLNGAIRTYDILLKSNVEENKQLKIQISAREEVCNRLESNWNKLKEIVKSQSGLKKKCHNGELWLEVDELLEIMHELEQGSDSNGQ